jgi:hypothetical protein
MENGMEASLNAECKAVEWCQHNGQPEWFDGNNEEIYVHLPSSSRPDLWHTAWYGHQQSFCTCEAHRNKRDCWHVAMARLIYNKQYPWQNNTIFAFEDYYPLSL